MGGTRGEVGVASALHDVLFSHVRLPHCPLRLPNAFGQPPRFSCQPTHCLALPVNAGQCRLTIVYGGTPFGPLYFPHKGFAICFRAGGGAIRERVGQG